MCSNTVTISCRIWMVYIYTCIVFEQADILFDNATCAHAPASFCDVLGQTILISPVVMRECCSDVIVMPRHDHPITMQTAAHLYMYNGYYMFTAFTLWWFKLTTQ